MQRPTSAASSATTQSQTSTTAKHDRAGCSRNGLQSTAPTVMSLFVTNLRLLNLDLLPEWPGITTASLGNQDARTRIRCTEFALFHLFRLYDAVTTADKLQPFFPPLESLQSINLRAALYRCLNEMKKNGVLRKETVLRKTMLDECQGDKFWEVCLGFSAIVLRKSMLERRRRSGRPTAEKLGVAPNVSQSQAESMLPLAIAHKAALSKTLGEKKKKRETYARLYDVLLEKEEDLQQRRLHAEKRAHSTSHQAENDKLEVIAHHIGTQWAGSDEFRTVIFHGGDRTADDDILAQPLGVLLHSLDENPTLAAEPGLLGNLKFEASDQAQRLRKWQDLHDTLLASKPSFDRPEGEDDPRKVKLRFDKHRSLSVRDSAPVNEEYPCQRCDTYASVSRYDEILTSMREGLRRNRRATAPEPPAPKPAAQPPLSRKPSIHLEITPGAPAPHQRSPSQTAVPVRPALSRRVSSRSRSYQQPKVESQRQPIPLKSELFSPLKGKPRRSTSPISATSFVASPTDASPASAITVDAVPSGDAGRGSQSREANGKSDSAVGLGIETSSSYETKQRSPHEGRRTPDGAEGGGESFGAFVKPSRPASRPNTSAGAVRPSLAERTRMSMAFTSSEDINRVLPEPRQAAKDPQKAPDLHEPPTETPAVDRAASLLDRTRQSISLAPQTSAPPPNNNKKKVSHTRSRTSVYPANPFDTPQKVRRRRSSVAVLEQPRRRDVTPREQLFSPAAEYDSVFRPRPKVALSPVLSPYVVDSKRVSMESKGAFEGLSGSSPLVGLEARQ